MRGFCGSSLGLHIDLWLGINLSHSEACRRGPRISHCFIFFSVSTRQKWPLLCFSSTAKVSYTGENPGWRRFGMHYAINRYYSSLRNLPANELNFVESKCHDCEVEGRCHPSIVDIMQSCFWCKLLCVWKSRSCRFFVQNLNLMKITRHMHLMKISWAGQQGQVVRPRIWTPPGPFWV